MSHFLLVPLDGSASAEQALPRETPAPLPLFMVAYMAGGAGPGGAMFAALR